MLARATLIALSFLVLATPARAQEGSIVDPDHAARELYAAGEIAYSEGRFDDALGIFQRAFELSGRPELLYNVGIAATNAGEERIALAAFERYIAELPDAENRALVEGRLQGLRDEIAEEEEIVRLGEVERQAIARERASGAIATQSAGIALAITGGALAAGGGVMLALGYVDLATVEGAAAGTPWVDLRGPAERAPILTGAGYAVAGVGLGLIGVGLGLALGTSAPTDAPTVRLGPGTLSIEGSF